MDDRAAIRLRRPEPGTGPVRLRRPETGLRLEIARGPEHYTVSDRPATEPTVVIYPGGRRTSADDGRAVWDEWSLGVRPWGHNHAGDCVLLAGAYEGEGEFSRPLLTALPPVVLLSCEAGRGFADPPPMSYLTTRRLALAADGPIFSDAPVASVARQVGCRTPISLSAAFQRVHGVSPQQYRLGKTNA